MSENKIWIRWFYNPTRKEYYVLDWGYEEPDQVIGTIFEINENGGDRREIIDVNSFELEKVTEGLIRTMAEVNKEYIELLGHFERIEEIESLDIDERDIEWEGPGYYVRWDDDRIVLALEALDVEYDIACASGEWLSFVTGWTRDIFTCQDAKNCLTDLYGCSDDECEKYIENYITDILDSHNVSRDFIPADIIDKILGRAPSINRIDPAYLP